MEVKYLEGCCGIRELHHLAEHRTPEDALHSMARAVYDRYSQDVRWRYAIFSQAGRAKYGDKFAAFIIDKGLGNVVNTEGVYKNPNTGNILKVWVWTIDHVAVKKWLKAHKGEERGIFGEDYDG